jgi:16S rRNA (cytosine967-C5)-methyltransferase
LTARLDLLVADAARPPFRPVPSVLLDVPCTGTGTLRRHPDGKWRLQPADLAALVRMQQKLLDAAAEMVAPGGLMIYSTCSLEPEENEDQVDAFLARHRAFERAPAPAGLDPALLTDAGELRVLPQLQHVDGAFAARLRRAA